MTTDLITSSQATWDEAPEEDKLAAVVAAAERRTGVVVPNKLRLQSLFRLAEQRGMFPHETFASFVKARNPGLMRHDHVKVIARELDRVERGEVLRLLIFLPPRYWKSETVSRLFAPYYLRKHPTHSVGLASYGADLAWELSEDAREHFRASGGSFKVDTAAKKRWATAEGGEMWASGVGGPILGRGYNLGIVDDPVDPEQAHSPTYHRRFRRWWPEKFLSRQEPGARIVFVMQRLGPDDPVDFLMRLEVGDGVPAAPQNWRVLALDEVKSSEPYGRWGGPMGLPPTCTLVDDWREEGEVLAPLRFDKAAVEVAHRSAGPFVAGAQRQQRPLRAAGDFWQAEWFDTYEELPGNAYNGGKDWDTAYSKEDANSASAWIETYRGPGAEGQFPIYVNDVDWRWLEFPGLVEWMRSLTGPHFVEAKATGKSLAQAVRPHGIAVKEVQVKGGKFERAAAVQPAAANKRIKVRREIRDKLLMGERQGLLRITAEQLIQEAGGLDVNDVFTQALTRHLGIGPGRPRARAY